MVGYYNLEKEKKEFYKTDESGLTQMIKVKRSIF